MLTRVSIEAVDKTKSSRSLMVVLHGLGDSEAGYRWLPGALRLDWMHYLLVNAPDPYFSGFSWFDFTGDADSGICRSRAFLFELLDEQRHRGFPTEQTTLFGFSQGCLMTWELGLRYPHRFAGLVGISGYVHEPKKVVQEWSPTALQQRFLVTHGTLDPLIPFAEVREQVQFLKESGLRIEWHALEKPHGLAGEEEIDIVREFVAAGYSNCPRSS